MNRTSTREKIVELLDYISSHKYDDWIKVGFIIKHELGDDGFDIWDKWSQTFDGYSNKETTKKWKSFNKDGSGLTIGTLLWMSRASGYNGKTSVLQSRFANKTVGNNSVGKSHVPNNRKKINHEHFIKDYIRRCSVQEHGYLLKRGFSSKHLVMDDKLIVPIMNYDTNQFIALQTINEKGEKKFYPYGCTVKNGVYRIGKAKHQEQIWWCEGFCTGLAIADALKVLRRSNDQVIVTFTAWNLGKIAANKKGVVVADNDEAGLNAAKTSGLPYITSSIEGQDAADMWMSNETTDLKEELLEKMMDNVTLQRRII